MHAAILLLVRLESKLLTWAIKIKHFCFFVWEMFITFRRNFIAKTTSPIEWQNLQNLPRDF